MYRLKRIVVFLFAASMVLAGFLMVSGLLLVRHASLDWPVAEAMIRKLEFIPLPHHRSDVMYELEYEFQVDGLTYRGSAISPRHTDGIISQDESEAYRKKYPPGSQVRVTYAPFAPDEHSFIEPVTWKDILFIPCGTLLFGLWILYLLRKTRVRTVPKRVFQNQEPADSPRWHAIYQSVLEKEQIEIRGTAWYARSNGLTRWPKSRVGLVATPNTIGVVRGSFTLTGYAAAAFTAIFEWFLSHWVAIAHALGFFLECGNRLQTWKFFEAGHDPNEYSTEHNSADIVSIDETIIHGYDARRHELWFRLPSRPVDDCVKLAPDMIDEIERFIGFVRLMQRSNQIATDDHAVIDDDVQFLD